jgi:riboflavin kinase/FMN adenylyltransferase
MSNKRIYALGFFDGVHLGHQALLTACRSLAEGLGLEAGVVTFGDHPDTLVHGKQPGLINTLADRERLLKNTFGMDAVVTLPFDREMMAMPWDGFIRFLIKNHDAAGFVCGDDFRFGHRGLGNGEKLRTLCAELDLPCRLVPQRTLDGLRVSSSHIRTLIEEGRMGEAVRFLGHPHILTGTVVPGKQLGRTLGIPTANLRLPLGLAVPKFGVYACRCRIGEETYGAVANIGTRPTVEGQGITIEPWILDFSGDLYRREITLEFLDFLRPEVKYPTLEALREEIQHNARQTREILKAL